MFEGVSQTLESQIFGAARTTFAPGERGRAMSLFDNTPIHSLSFLTTF